MRKGVQLDAPTRLDDQWGKMPLYFIANQGQMDDRVAYYIQGSDTITVGAPTGNSGRGASYIFVKPGGGWSGNPAQLARLIAANLLYLPLNLR